MADGLMQDLRWWWVNLIAEIRLRWQLAMYGEVMILNAIDAIHAAGHQIDEEPVDAKGALYFHDIALAHLKQVISYEDEPGPTDPYEYEGDGVSHVVPKDYAIHQGNQ